MDEICDRYLRPLRSRSAREIFKVFVDFGSARSLTTLDLQSSLERKGMKLDKKEINGWLISLQSSGLIERYPQRGKPTTVEYRGRYTFARWGITDLGLTIAGRLPRLLDRDPSIVNDDVLETLEKLAAQGNGKAGAVLERIREFYTLLAAMKALQDARSPLSLTALHEHVGPSPSDLERALSKYSDETKTNILFMMRSRRGGLKIRFMNILGLSIKDIDYSLSERGEKLAESIWA